MKLHIPAATALTTELMTAFASKISGSTCQGLKGDHKLLRAVLKDFVVTALSSISDN